MIRRVIPALGDFEARLRRVLGLVGEVGSTFQPTLTSVLIADDLRSVGNPEYRGKRFAWGQGNVTVGAAGRVGIRALDAVVLTRVRFQCHMASLGTVTARKSVGATIGTYPLREVGWRDRSAADTDVAPLESTSTLQASSTQGVNLGQWTCQTGGPAPVLELRDVFLGAGQQFYLNINQAATSFGWQIEGYVY